jgi:hypothetical protein
MIALPFLLFAALGSAEEPARSEAAGPESEAASEEESVPSGMAEEILITLQVPLFSPLFASTPLASVEDEPITMEELTRSIASSHAGRTDGETPIKKNFVSLLDRLLTTKLIIQEARNIGLDELPAVAARIDQFAWDLLVNNLMSRELESVEADPADVDRLYQRMSREFLLTTVQFENAEDALAFEEQYAAEGDFTTLAMRFFEEGKATGELGSEEYVKLKDLLPEVAQTADSLEVGAVSRIFRASDGFLVFYVRDIRVYEDPGLREEARRRIIETLRQERAGEYADALERKHATVDYDLLADVSFMPRKTGLPFFRREVPVDQEQLLSDDRVLATVHSEAPFEITVGDLARKVGSSFYHGMKKGLEGRKDLDRRSRVTLKNMVFEKTGPMEARRQGLDREEEYLDAVEQKTASLLFGSFVRKVIAPDVTIREEEVRQYYEEHLDDFSTPKMVRLNGLVFDELPDAESALNKLRRGADFRWVSANTPGQLDEDTAKALDFDNVLLSVNSLPEGLKQTARGARRGDAMLYSGPDEFYYVVVVSSVFPPQPQAYEQAREEIAELITVEKVKDLVADWGVKLREAYEPRIFLHGLPE